MPEIPNVVPGEPVEADWGNDIRDRSVQKYADLTALEASQPVPQLGELAWLDNPGHLVVCTDAIAPTWEPLVLLVDANGDYVLKAGDTMTGQLRIQGENIVTEGDSLGLFMIPTPGTSTDDWRVIASSSGGLLMQSRNSGTFASLVLVQPSQVLVQVDQLTMRGQNSRVVLARSGLTEQARMAQAGDGNMLLQVSDDNGSNWTTMLEITATGADVRLPAGRRLQVLGDELTLDGSGTNKVRYTNAGTAIQADRDAVWVSTGVPPNYRLDTIATLADADPVVADFFTDSPAAAALAGGHPADGPTHRDIIQALVHEVQALRARVDALEGP